MMNPSIETHPCKNRIPVPTPNDPERTRSCRGTIQQRVYVPDYWYVENCDTCQYLAVGFEDRPIEMLRRVQYGKWV